MYIRQREDAFAYRIFRVLSGGVDKAHDQTVNCNLKVVILLVLDLGADNVGRIDSALNILLDV